MTALRVLIAGGGIGGLCLAQGLRRAGVEVAVYERAATAAAFREGYRLHISPEGSRALAACLPAELFQAVQATSGRPPRAMSFVTEHLAELLSADVLPDDAEPDPIAAHRSVNRHTLRRILLDGLDDVVRFAKECVGYERRGDTVTAHFADGSSAEGDVLVGAEGGRSAVRAELLPHAGRVETGMISVGGLLPLTAETRRLLPPQLLRGPAGVLAPHGFSMFVATHEAVIPDAYRHLAPPDARDTVVWGFTGPEYGLPTDGRSGEELRELVLSRTRGWDPRLRALVELAEADSLNAITIRTAVPVRAWPAGNVTVLGDAIHSMPPSLGVGANIALRDAEVLAGKLSAVACGELPLVRAVGAYEEEMRGYGFAAVRASNRALRQSAITGRLAFATTRTALRIMNALPAVKRRVFQ